VLSVVLFI